MSVTMLTPGNRNVTFKKQRKNMNPWDQDLRNEEVDWWICASGYVHAKWLSFPN